MTRPCGFASLLAAMLFFPAIACACECQPASFEKRVQESERIFVGEVTDVSKSLLPWNKQDPHEVMLRATEAFKGEGGTVKVMDHWFCGYLFEQGKKYLVFASKDERGSLHVYSTCGGSVPIPEREYPHLARELGRLRELPAGVH
ncbi:MAG: hypothetical protein J0L97_01405 [Alphaproteobacteria bacterium]|nr:hypothetical protein [Alphaproteobacteria bacterium]